MYSGLSRKQMVAINVFALTNKRLLWVVLLSLALPLSHESVADPTKLPLIKDLHAHLEYKGAFKMSGAQNGVSKLNNSEAIFDVKTTGPTTGTFFMTSHLSTVTCDLNNNATHLHGIAELAIPTLVKHNNIQDAVHTDLNEATFVQPFVDMLKYEEVDPAKAINTKSVDAGDPDCMDRITGIKYLNGGLILNAMEYYDGNNNNVDTTLHVENASDLANTPLHGFFQLDGAAHLARWISDVPTEWQTLLGGKHIFGNGNNYPRLTRQSLGPSAFVVDSTSIGPGKASAVSSIKLLDYTMTKLDGQIYPGIGSYHGALHTDFFNVDGANHLWTQKSKAVYGFIPPGSRTYVVIGSSGGHNTRICYKNTYYNSVIAFNNGKVSSPDHACASIRTSTEYNAMTAEEKVGVTVCGGYCMVNPDDVYNYYWLYDVLDMIKVKNGEVAPSDVKPYATGKFNAPFQKTLTGSYKFLPLGSASYDAQHSELYVSIQQAGSSGMENNRPPVIAVYKFKFAPVAPATFTVE